MRLATWLFFGVLAAYSAALLATEANTSQDFVRHYFSDIDAGRPFFAINTTLSTMLLASAGVLMVFAACTPLDHSPHPASAANTRWLLWTQAGILGFLAFDDRFQLHEALAYRLDIGDHFIMATWAVLELALLAAFARRDQIPFKTFAFVAVGGAFFAVMMAFDALVQHDMILRLSIEDLAKSWAAACFFAAAWCLVRYHLGFERSSLTLGDWMARHFGEAFARPHSTPFHTRQARGER